MKKRIIILPAMLLTLSVLAQPTFDNSLFGEIGYSWNQTLCDATGFDPGLSGADVVWDFSDITITGPETTQHLVDPSASPYVASFGLANLALTLDNIDYTFMQVTGTEYNNLGSGTTVAVVSYSDPETIFTFPLTYNTVSEDDFGATFTSMGFSFIRDGEADMIADGWGTLILPTGTFTNVLRVKLEEDYTDESVGLPVPVVNEYNYDHYYWFAEGVTNFVFYYGDLESSVAGMPANTKVAVLNTSATSSIQDNHLPENLVQVYPNPASGHFFIYNTSNMAFESIALFNMMGERVYIQTGQTGTNTEINTTGLPAGIYTLQLKSTMGVLSKMVHIL